MDPSTRTQYDNLASEDSDLRYAAYIFLLAASEQPVDWAYEVWDELIAYLQHKNNHLRTIAAQLLCNLAVSDPERRILTDFPALLAVARDKRFVTARHTLQALWRVGLAGPEQQRVTVDGLADRFEDCADEKQCTLIRHDIAQGLRHLYDATQDERIRERAVALIATEEDEKYRKKYLTVWMR